MPLFDKKLAAERQAKAGNVAGNIWKALTEQPKIKPRDLPKIGVELAKAATFPFSMVLKAGDSKWDGASGAMDIFDETPVGNASIQNFPSLAKFLNQKTEPTSEPLNNFVRNIFNKGDAASVGHTLMDLEKTDDAKGLIAKLKSQHPEVAYVPAPQIHENGASLEGFYSIKPDQQRLNGETIRDWAKRVDPGNERVKDAKHIISIKSTLPETNYLGVLGHENQHKIESDHMSRRNGEVLNGLADARRVGMAGFVPDDLLRNVLTMADYMKVRDVPNSELFRTADLKNNAIDKIISKYRDAAINGSDELYLRYMNTALHHRDYKNYELDIPARALLEDAFKNGEPIHQSWKDNYWGLLHKLKNQK